MLERIIHWSRQQVSAIRLQRRAAEPQPLRLKSRLSLGPHHQLFLVEAGDQQLLIATAPQSVQLLSMERRKDVPR